MGSYYDVDAILTDAQKVPCTFELTVPGLGYLEGNMSGDIKQGSKVELPLWLGEMLALRYKNDFFNLISIMCLHCVQPESEYILSCDHRPSLRPLSTRLERPQS